MNKTENGRGDPSALSNSTFDLDYQHEITNFANRINASSQISEFEVRRATAPTV